AQSSPLVDVSPSFRPGPYTAISVDLARPERIAVGTADGYVAWSNDGGRTTDESQVVAVRQYVFHSPRGGNISHRGYRGYGPPRGAMRLFLQLLKDGLPVTRWSPWMALENPSAEITGVALPPVPGRLLAASPAGILVSDARRSVWSRALGGPRPKGED